MIRLDGLATSAYTVTGPRGIAQLVEQLIPNQQVGSSSLSAPAILNRHLRVSFFLMSIDDKRGIATFEHRNQPRCYIDRG